MTKSSYCGNGGCVDVTFADGRVEVRNTRAPQKVLTFTVIVSLFIHVWVGMRDIWMDYVKPVSIRLTLDILTIVWLVGCAGWAIQVLWRL